MTCAREGKTRTAALSLRLFCIQTRIVQRVRCSSGSIPCVWPNVCRTLALWNALDCANGPMYFSPASFTNLQIKLVTNGARECQVYTLLTDNLGGVPR